MKSLPNLLPTLFVLFALTVAARAADADPSGKWTWSGITGQGSPTTITAQLTLKDGALSGTADHGDAKIALTTLSFKDGVVAFSVSREIHGGMIFEEKYSGKLDSDSITGTVTRPTPPAGEIAAAPWKAVRAH